jgi:antitoxin ParD1/3/4
MTTTERLQVTLPAELVRLLRERVQQGGYASEGEAIAEALRRWQPEPERPQDRLAELRARIAEADADPRPSLTEAEVAAHFARRAAARPG